MPLPSPRTWENGEDVANAPMAEDLNLDWRDSFNFVLGYNLPIILLQSTVSQTLTVNTFITINFQTEVLKRGGMTHAVNGSTITVPYTGQYMGYMYGGFGAFSTISGKMKLRLLKNGTTSIADANQTPENLTGSELHCAITADLAANDTVAMQMLYSAGTGSSSTTAGNNRPKLALWYVGDYV